MRWHFTISAPDDGVANMALDEALMRRAARSGEAVFRVYGWSAPTLSLGRNQRARGCYNLAAASSAGVGFVRRPTGGRALLHHREITYSVTMPITEAREAHAAYDFINDVLIAGLRRMGVQARRAEQTTALPPGLRPCFDVPADHEIVLDSGKLIGSAQWRKDGALLQHGSILVRNDQGLIAELLATPVPAAGRAATLHDALGRDPEPSEVAASLRDCLGDATGTEAASLVIDGALEADWARLRASYGDEAWTWRR